MVDTVIVFNHKKIGKSVERFGSSGLEISNYKIYSYFLQTTIYLLQFLISFHRSPVAYHIFLIRTKLFKFVSIFLYLFNIFYNFLQVTQQNYHLNCNVSRQHTFVFFAGFYFPYRVAINV